MKKYVIFALIVFTSLIGADTSLAKTVSISTAWEKNTTSGTKTLGTSPTVDLYALAVAKSCQHLAEIYNSLRTVASHTYEEAMASDAVSEENVRLNFEAYNACEMVARTISYGRGFCPDDGFFSYDSISLDEQFEVMTVCAILFERYRDFKLLSYAPLGE